MAANTIKDYILYYKNKLDRYKDDEDMVIETIQKLGKPSVNAEVVQETGILRNLHKLVKEKGKVSETARALLAKWKHLPSARDKKSPEEQQASSLVKAAPPREADPPVWGNHVGAAREPAIHPAHRINNQDIIHPDPGSAKRKDPFTSEAEHKRLNPTHHLHREAKHPTPQKDHRSTNHHDSNLDRSKHSATKEFFPPENDVSRHSVTRKHLFPSDVDKSTFTPGGAMDSSRNPPAYKDTFGPDGHLRHPTDSLNLDGHHSRHPPHHRDSFGLDSHTRHHKDSFGLDSHSSSGPDGYSRHHSLRDSFGPDHSSVPDSHGRHSLAHRDSFGLDSHHSSSSESHSRHPRRDSSDSHSSSATDGHSRHAKKDFFSAEGQFSRHPASRNDHFVHDGESSRHALAKEGHFDHNESSRHSTSHKDHFVPDVDLARHSSTRKEHFGADDGHSRHFRKDHTGDGEMPRHSMRKDHSHHDVEFSRHPVGKRDHFTPEGLSSHRNKDPVRSETTSLRGDFKARRKELFPPDNDSHRNRNSRYSSTQRDVFPSETDGVVFNKDDETRHLKKDYFAPDADETELNGTFSQEHDIDSLSNPNLNIDTGHLNISDDSEHASPTKRARAREPYYIEMREGMFRAIKNPDCPGVNEEGLRFYELIKREIRSGYKPKEINSEKDKNNTTLTMSPRDASNDCEKWNTKNNPSDPKMAAGKTAHNSKRKSDSPSKGRDKRMCIESAYNPDFKIKSEPSKGKSDSPSKGRDKRMCIESAYNPDLKIKSEPLSPNANFSVDPQLKVKKEPVSPSHLPKSASNHAEGHQSNCDRNSKSAKTQDSPETSAMQYMSSSKKDRRSVYSGRKTVQEIAPLKSMCLQVLRKHLDYLRCPKKVPYQSLQPLLETLNPSQLAKVEEHNRFLIGSTNNLWKQHYHRDHRSQVVMKKESEIIWKDEYNRAQEIKRKKLKNITAGINAAASKAKPDRQAKVIETQVDFGRRGARNSEVPATGSSKSSVPTPSPVVANRSSPTSKAASANPKANGPPANSKPKEPKHLAAHKPSKKAVAPLMNKVKKSMAIVYSRQK